MKKNSVRYFILLALLAAGPACVTSSGATGLVIYVTATPDSGGAGGQETVQGILTPTETVPAAVPTFTPTFAVVHLTTPPETSGTTRYITDPESRDYAPQKKAPAGSDIFTQNRWERPFNGEAMEYLSDVDLKRVEMKIASPWVYITLEISSPRAQGIGQTMYGAEFDTDKDGRGEFLIWGASPSGAAWTTDGVQVRQDGNNNVGGVHPQISDTPGAGTDGYELVVFDGGQGADPDLAWIRQTAGGGKIQLAFKQSLLGGASQFLWNGLADSGIRRADWYDYNDHFTAAEAGSPQAWDTAPYPVKALFGVDNTCRDAYGFAPTGNEPGLCIYYGTISGEVFYDGMSNGVIDPGEPGLPGMTVVLGKGGCPSATEKTATTDAGGIYSFPDLPQGPYCVHFVNTAIWNLNTTPNPAAVTLPPGGNLTVNFGTGQT